MGSLFSRLSVFIKGRKLKPRKQIALCDLPILALNEVLRSMTHIELIRLALTSKKMERAVKDARIKLQTYRNVIRGKASGIDFKGLDGMHSGFLYCGYLERNENEKIKRSQLKHWLPKNGSEFDNLAEVNNRLQKLFLTQNPDLHFIGDELRERDISKYPFLVKLLENSRTTLLYGGKIKSETLSFILEKANSKQSFELRDVEVPEDFYSKYAFKFRYTKYNDANWVKPEHLIKSRGLNYIHLEKNKLTVVNFNYLIKYWVDSEFIMWRNLSIDLESPIRRIEPIFDGVTVLRSHTPSEVLYFILPKSGKKSAKVLLVSCSATLFEISSIYAEENIPLAYTDTLYKTDREYKILNILARREKLEADGNENEEELTKIDQELEENQVIFFRGMHTIGL